MELTSPPPCPTTVTVRRNPPRRARPTPYTTTQPPPHPPPKTPTPSSAIRSFPINDILSIDIPNETSKPPIEQSDSEKLKVFLRIRPILVTTQNNTKVLKKNVWPKERKKDVAVVGRKRKDKENEICLRVNDDHSVTLNPPTNVAEVRRTKSEVYQGFSYVFAPEASQNEVYERMVNPLVKDVLKGKSGMLAAMGPSGSGKTHTVFGSARDPGMVSLALRQIFSEKGSNGSNSSRTFYLSMFEIYSERGKGERIMDLSPDGGDLSMQQSTIKGLQEVVIHDVQQAESFIATGMLKRSTAMTNSNIQSSRSQCIINIRCDIDNFDEDAAAQSSTAILTIVDLAGAEREKRTGNQGTRLVESNFINNTSMVFGLCLRSLLEHQKNRKKPLHKHFQNSLLTKYLRDFLQGKKRMSLILTAKSGDEDYQDTSYLLRQAAPYMNIKFENVEEQPANTFGNKRRTQILSKAEQVKRMKLNSNGVCTDDEVRSDILHQPNKELIPKKDEDAEFNGSSAECPVIIDAEADFDKSLGENAANLSKTARENQILLKFSRALWNVLKEYKSKLDANVDEVNSLRHSLTAEKERCSVLETELNLMKASCSCGKEAVAEVEENDSKAELTDCTVELERYQPIDVLESNAKVSSSHAAILAISTDTVDAQVSCSNLYKEEHVDSGLVSGLNGTSFAEVVSTSLSVQNVEEHSNEKENVSVEYVLFDKEDLKGLADLDLSCEIADTVTDLAKAVSVSSVLEMSEEKSTEKFGDSSPKVLFDKQEFNEVQEREVIREITDLAGLGSELSSVVGDEASSTLEEDKPEQEEKQVTRSLEVISISSEVEKCVDQSIKEINESSPNAVFDKQEFSEVEDMEADGEIQGCDSLDTAGLGSELPYVVDNEVSSILEEDILESTIHAQVIGSVEVTSTSSEEEKFVEQSNKEIDEPSPNALLDEKEFTEVEEREANGEQSGFHSLASAGRGSEFSPVVGDESSYTFEEDKPENEKEAPRSVEVVSVSNELALFEEQSNKKIDELTPNIVLVKQEVKEVEARVTDGERTGCDGSDTAAQGSELPSVDAEEISDTLEEDKSAHEKEENVVLSSSNLEGSNCVGNKHLLDTEVPDQHLVLPGDVISSQKSNASKAPSVQPCQSNLTKPKRRLRPASSVMLRNINILEFDDATEMPKNHGKRGEKEDVGKKRTQGNISLLRLLKQNLHH